MFSKRSCHMTVTFSKRDCPLQSEYYHYASAFLLTLTALSLAAVALTLDLNIELQLLVVGPCHCWW